MYAHANFGGIGLNLCAVQVSPLEKTNQQTSVVHENGEEEAQA